MAEGLAEVVDHGLHLDEGGTGLEVEVPFAGESMGQLLDLDIVERFFEHHEAFGVGEAGAHLIPGIVGIGGADDDLEGGIDGPESADGFDAVPAWGHADVHEGEGEGLEVDDGLVDEVEGVLSLVSGFQLIGEEAGGRGGFGEEDVFEVGDLGVGGVIGAEDFFEIGVDGGVIVDDQDASVVVEGAEGA
jgi:hypothetical protein